MSVLYVPLSRLTNTNQAYDAVLVTDYISTFDKESFDAVDIIEDSHCSETLVELSDVEILSNRIEHVLVPMLNSYSGFEFDELFWHRMLHYWLGTYLTSIFQALLVLDTANKYIAQFDKVFSCLPVIDKKLILSNEDFVWQAFTDLYNAYVFGKLIELDNRMAIEYQSISTERENNISEKSSFHVGMQGLVEKVNFRLMLHRKKAVRVQYYGQDYPQDFIYYLTIKSHGRIQPLQLSNMNSTMAIDSEFRKKIHDKLFESGLFTSEWQKKAVLLLADFLPLFFLEDFNNQVKYCEDYLRNYPNMRAIKTMAGGIYLNSQRLCGALLQNKGGYHVGEAHGWGYRVAKGIIDEEKIIYNKFYVMGRIGDNSGDIIGAPSFRLSGTKRNNKKYILFGGTTIFKPTFGILKWNTSSQRRYLDRRIEFISFLREESRNAIVFREREEVGWPIRKLLEQLQPDKLCFSVNAFKNMNEDATKRNNSFKADLMECSLFICDHISTMWAEALMSDIPSIVLLDDQCCRIEETENELFSEMKKAGLFFTEPRKLAEFINENYNTIDYWWNDLSRQEIVKKARLRYIYEAEDVKTWWLKELLKY